MEVVKMKLKLNELVNRMEQKGINYSELSLLTGISRQTISSWVNGHRDPMPFNVEKMAEILHCRVEDIAEAQDGIELAALHGDQFARELMGITKDTTGEKYSIESQLLPETVQYIRHRVSAETTFKSKSELGRKLGLSGSQSGRIARGEADLTLMPLSAFLRLCPELIDKGILTGKPESQLLSFCRNLSAEDQEKALAILQAVFANK
jgi:transcriptional regulator with XRE-family HTH domain